ncbi:hypothetical protein [Zhihengliuella sp.]|uniref:hypothetical protein n=1 Tax=Zhihengliuella sp. TaxID=1954483 RepID=UPI00281266A7|nr:hypothetical protein [Zhihengliuella sp.]
MSRLLFPDNTVLCNFAAVHRMPLLRDFLRGDGRWTQAVFAEARRSSDFLPALSELLSAQWLGEPIEVVDNGIERIRRVVFGGTPSEPTRHLGEAETCHLILEHEDYAGAAWITDDRDAYEYAQGKGIQTMDTLYILMALVSDGDLTPEMAHDLQNAMVDVDRSLLRTFGKPDDFRR